MFLNALSSLSVPFNDIIKACKDAEMPYQLIADLSDLKEGKELFSELKPAQYHRLVKYLVGDPTVCVSDIKGVFNDYSTSTPYHPERATIFLIRF